MQNFQIDISFWWLGLMSYTPFHLIHVWLWRKKPLRHEVLRLCTWLLIVPTFLWCLTHLILGSPIIPEVALAFHWLLAANYIAIYPAFQASSPTVHILCLVAKYPQGITEEALAIKLSKIMGLTDRVKDLQKSKLLISDNQGLRVSVNGKIIALFFINFRKFLGLTRGAG